VRIPLPTGGLGSGLPLCRFTLQEEGEEFCRARAVSTKPNISTSRPPLSTLHQTIQVSVSPASGILNRFQREQNSRCRLHNGLTLVSLADLVLGLGLRCLCPKMLSSAAGGFPRTAAAFWFNNDVTRRYSCEGQTC
jgi:hypothetical protein